MLILFEIIYSFNIEHSFLDNFTFFFTWVDLQKKNILLVDHNQKKFGHPPITAGCLDCLE